MDERDYGELLDLIYEAAIEPELWSGVLNRMAAAFARLVDLWRASGSVE